jgi:hypothetical protein
MFLGALDKGMRIIMLAFGVAQPDYASGGTDEVIFVNFNAQLEQKREGTTP